jgi:hypothetical protein
MHLLCVFLQTVHTIDYWCLLYYQSILSNFRCNQIRATTPETTKPTREIYPHNSVSLELLLVPKSILVRDIYINIIYIHMYIITKGDLLD